MILPVSLKLQRMIAFSQFQKGRKLYLVITVPHESKNTEDRSLGAAIYRTKFQSNWTKEWPSIECVQDMVNMPSGAQFPQTCFMCTHLHCTWHVMTSLINPELSTLTHIVRETHASAPQLTLTRKSNKLARPTKTLQVRKVEDVCGMG